MHEFDCLFLCLDISSLDFHKRLNVAHYSHRIMRRDMDNVKPVQLQLDSPKYRKLTDEILKQEQQRRSGMQSLEQKFNFTGTARLLCNLILSFYQMNVNNGRKTWHQI